MPLKSPSRQRQHGPPPGETGQETLYLRFLSERQVPVTVKLRDGEAVYGWIEYFDDRMIRLTREGKPNLFIYKNQIRTISESIRNIEARRRERKRGSAAQIAAAALDVPHALDIPAANVDSASQGERNLSVEPPEHPIISLAVMPDSGSKTDRAEGASKDLGNS